MDWRVPPAAAAPPALARGPVFTAMAAVAALLTVSAGRYGYHRDELYFRMLDPAWGYVDQPPLTPLLARAMSSLVADEVWAVRIPATAATTLSVLVVVLITRELGGNRGAQTLCAWGYAFASMPLLMGHVMLTSSIDLVVWPLVTLFVVRATTRRQPEWWLAAGVVVGLSMYNKLLVAALLLSLTAGLLLVGPRQVLMSRWVVGAAGLALLIGAPNLLYQAAADWPQLTMGAALSENNAAEVRVLMWPFLLLLLGPPLVPVWVAGMVALIRRPAWRPVRFLVPAFGMLLVFTFVAGGQIYYPVGLMAVLFAAGCVPVAEYVAAAPAFRRPGAVAAVALNAVVSAVIALPILPLSLLGGTPVPGLNQIAADQIGWPVYVRQIATAHAGLSDADARRAVVVTSNYGEAGAVARYGPELGLPAVYSGHNELWFVARPPAETGVVVMVGGQLDAVRPHFASCEVVDTLDNDVGVDNEEQGQPVAVCRGPADPWPVIWPSFQHYD